MESREGCEGRQRADELLLWGSGGGVNSKQQRRALSTGRTSRLTFGGVYSARVKRLWWAAVKISMPSGTRAECLSSHSPLHEDVRSPVQLD